MQWNKRKWTWSQTVSALNRYICHSSLINQRDFFRPSSSSSSSDRRSLGADEASQEALRHAGSAFFLVRPRSNNNQLMYDQAMLAAAQANAMASAMANMQQQQQGGNSNDPMSPLQRMQVHVSANVQSSNAWIMVLSNSFRLPSRWKLMSFSSLVPWNQRKAIVNWKGSWKRRVLCFAEHRELDNDETECDREPNPAAAQGCAAARHTGGVRPLRHPQYGRSRQEGEGLAQPVLHQSKVSALPLPRATACEIEGRFLMFSPPNLCAGITRIRGLREGGGLAGVQTTFTCQSQKSKQISVNFHSWSEERWFELCTCVCPRIQSLRFTRVHPQTWIVCWNLGLKWKSGANKSGLNCT